jgi:hypothetical protein
MARISINGAFASKGRMALVGAAGLVASLGGMALAAQDRYSLKIPNGLSFSDFRGYEDWKDVSVSQTEHSIKVISANDAAIKAYRSGVPDNGKLFPDGSKFAKIEWSFKKNEASPYFVNIPDALKSLSFIEKDTKRFPKTHGWAYAQWSYDPATDTFKPSDLDPSGPECGFACHTVVANHDYIFTAYPKR